MIVYMVFTYVIHTERYMKIQYIEIYRKYVIGVSLAVRLSSLAVRLQCRVPLLRIYHIFQNIVFSYTSLYE